MTLTPLGSASLLSELAWDDYCILNNISDPFKTKTVHSEAKTTLLLSFAFIQLSFHDFNSVEYMPLLLQ